MLSVMDWPPLNPDFKILEAVWDHLDTEQKAAHIQRKALIVLQEARRAIPEDKDVTRTLV